jgi:hypothetical protein
LVAHRIAVDMWAQHQDGCSIHWNVHLYSRK